MRLLRRIGGWFLEDIEVGWYGGVNGVRLGCVVRYSGLLDMVVFDVALRDLRCVYGIAASVGDHHRFMSIHSPQLLLCFYMYSYRSFPAFWVCIGLLLNVLA